MPTTFRPEIEVEGVRTRVMVDHLAAVDLSRIGQAVRTLTWDEMSEVDKAFDILLGLAR